LPSDIIDSARYMLGLGSGSIPVLDRIEDAVLHDLPPKDSICMKVRVHAGVRSSV
jgi:hypothetical protein